MDPNKQILNEILQLSRDTNKTLHSIRRSSFMWGFLKFLTYLIIFAAPIWFYLTYVSGTIDELVTALDKVQGSTSSAEQTKFDGFEAAVKKFESQLPAFMQPHNGTSSALQ